MSRLREIAKGRRVRMVTLAVLVVGICAAAILVARRETRSGLPTARTDLPVVGSRAPGQQRRWKLAFDVFLQQAGQREPVQTQVTGDWVATVSAARDGEYDLEYELENVVVSGGGVANVSPSDVEGLRRRLSRPFWLTYRDDGAVLKAHFPKDSQGSDRNLLQMIATEMQLVRPDQKPAQWTAIERDGAGLFMAAYQTGDQGTVIKRKLKYLESSGASGAQGTPNIPVSIEQSEYRFVVDSGGGVTSLEGSERIRIPMPFGEGGGLDIRTSIRLSDLRVQVVSNLIGSLDRARATVETLPIQTQQPDPAQARARLDQQLLEGYSTEALLGMARSKTDDHALPGRLAALFRQRAGAIDEAVGLLGHPGSAGLVIDALGSAGTPAAVQALGRTTHETKYPTDLRVRALSALMRVQQPSVEAMRIPRDLLDNPDQAVSRTAAMAMGALARAGRTSQPAEADAIDQFMIDRYGKTAEANGRIELLSAMGNSAGLALLPTVEAALHDSASKVRAAAARALRLVDDPAAARLLADTMIGDHDATVRSAAIFAATFRSMEDSLVAALLQAAKSDLVDQVRSEAIVLLLRHQSSLPQVSQALANIADNDPKERIRRLARGNSQPPATGLASSPAGKKLSQGAKSPQ
jgi:HEAT repeat protein